MGKRSSDDVRTGGDGGALGAAGVARVWLVSLGPMLVVGLAAVWLGGWSLRVQITATGVVLGCAFASVWMAHRVLGSPLRAVANLLDAMAEGEYALRAGAGWGVAGGGAPGDPVGLVARSANRLADALRDRRWSARETAGLLDLLLARLEAAVLLLDDRGRIVTANPAAVGLLGIEQGGLIGRDADGFGLRRFVEASSGAVVDHAFPTRAGRWEVRRAAVRLEGREHALLIISDLTRALREEERRAWERLVQVLRHEVNNSLAPITSLAGSLARRVARSGGDGEVDGAAREELRTDLAEGLGVIASRAGGLTRFLGAYSRLSRLPPAALRERPIGPLVRRIAALQTAVPVCVPEGDGPTVLIDSAQLEQVLLNLVTNSAEATLERYPSAGDDACPAITVEWSESVGEPGFLEVNITDCGVGLPASENLFVPFFTTKPSGTGIGLVLSRRIIEGHGGRLTLRAGPGGEGCTASLTLRIVRGGDGAGAGSWGERLGGHGARGARTS
ncbi:MAG: sensor histidine kinase [Phycisphaerales bacterium]